MPLERSNKGRRADCHARTACDGRSWPVRSIDVEKTVVTRSDQCDRQSNLTYESAKGGKSFSKQCEKCDFSRLVIRRESRIYARAGEEGSGWEMENYSVRINYPQAARGDADESPAFHDAQPKQHADHIRKREDVIVLTSDTKGGLFNPRALLFLTLWYVFSGCTLFLNKVALLVQCRALTKVSRQCIREGRLNSPLIPLSFENPSRPRLMNTNATFHFDYLILASCILKKKKRETTE